MTAQLRDFDNETPYTRIILRKDGTREIQEVNCDFFNDVLEKFFDEEDD